MKMLVVNLKLSNHHLEIQGNEEMIHSVSFINPIDPEKLYGSIENVTPVMRKCIDQLEEYFFGKRQIFTIPYALVGTDFQNRVWRELEKIPYGETISYLELAKRLGDEKCIRAAASANGKNKLGIIVPCHRVIGANGSLTGYAGGIENKKILLELEKRNSKIIGGLF
jgi:methylated-DNA-[protein]-cysteine S-methyltransferase